METSIWKEGKTASGQKQYPKQHGESKVEKLGAYSPHYGAFVFQNMPQELFIRHFH